MVSGMMVGMVVPGPCSTFCLMPSTELPLLCSEPMVRNSSLSWELEIVTKYQCEVVRKDRRGGVLEAPRP